MKNLVILGMHRSGTSLIARALANAGLAVGEPDDLLVDQEDNPHGFYERRDVVALDDALLEHQNATWFATTQPTLPAFSTVRNNQFAAECNHSHKARTHRNQSIQGSSRRAHNTVRTV